MRAPLVIGAVALLGAAPPALGQTGTATAPTAPAGDGAAALRATALDAAAGWRGLLDAYRAPQLPTPSDTASVILLLDGPPAAAAPPGGRAAAAKAISERQRGLDSVLQDLGATVTYRYRMLVNAVAVRLPSGRVEALGALVGVRAVVPVSYLAPAQATAPEEIAPARTSPADSAAARRPAEGARGRAAHIALIDAGIDPSHPWLGGGMGPTFPIIGGADLVDGDSDPRADPRRPAQEAHGTQMAGIVLRSPALQGLPAARMPRLVSYRVVGQEAVDGRLQALARSDRVLAAMERAVDPDSDGSTDDAAQVILIGLAAGFEGGGVDPLAEAAASAQQIGSTVVAPAGNDGPTFSRPGSVGGLAASQSVIAVGATTDAAPRTADLDALLGPASARLGPLPLLGPEPGAGSLEVAVVSGPAGLATGDEPGDFRDASGASRVAGRLAVVARGDGSIVAKAANAADAGAAALAIWDENGPATFGAVAGDGRLALPVVGLGQDQGSALARLAAQETGLTVALRSSAPASVKPRVASYSSWGPTIDGRQKPDLVAPGSAVVTAWPGPAAGGGPAQATLTGTSAAAAEVAAIALRLRVDHPDLGPRAVRSILVQSATPLQGVANARQGAGRLGLVTEPRLRVSPAIVASRPKGDGAVAHLVIADLAGTGGRYVVGLDDAAGDPPLAGPLRLAPGGRTAVDVPLPTRGSQGRLIVRDADTGSAVSSVLVMPSRPARTPSDALGTPEVRTTGGLPEALVRIGLLRHDDGRITSAPLHGVRLELVPAAGGEALPVSGAAQTGAWPAGTYRFLIARRLASGLDVPAGTYRLRATATGPDGRTLTRTGRPFTLG
ncbi:MAG: S8 family serine peptidase [Thermoleophilia bacterium]